MEIKKRSGAANKKWREKSSEKGKILLKNGQALAPGKWKNGKKGKVIP